MIIYDLKCDKKHKFEGWFKDLAAFEQQKSQKLITCPICGSAEVAMVPSSIAVMGKSRELKDPKASATDLSPMKMLEMIHDFVSKNFDDVGNRFTEVALKIHRGEETRRNIRGVTTEKEEETLRDEGVDFVKIPAPKFDS
ncbi:MAG TPA: DUF1178 family protein [Syntrophales bacterium]|nr:DUF1178 family protein [Syntrophales bacterium]